MAFDLATQDAILKDKYLPAVRKQINDSTYFLNQIRRNKEIDFSGRKALMALQTGHTQGVGARKDGGTLPTAKNVPYANAVFYIKNFYGRIKVTGQAMRAAKNDAGSWVRAVDSEMRSLAKSLQTDFNRQLYHDGSGFLTDVAAGSTSSQAEVASTRFIEPGMNLISLTRADGNDPRAIVVGSIIDATSFNYTGDDLSTATAHTTTEGLIRGDDASAGLACTRDFDSPGAYDQPLDIWGLEAIVSTTNPTTNGLGTGASKEGLFGDIDRTTNNFWKCNDVDAGGDALTTLDLQEGWDESDIEGDARPGIILTDHVSKRIYGALLTPDKRYPAGADITLDGGYRGLDFNGAAMVADKDASLTNDPTPSNFNRFYFLTMSTFEMHVMGDWQWMDEDGAVLSRVANEDAYEATMFGDFQVGCDRPNANTIVRNFT